MESIQSQIWQMFYYAAIPLGIIFSLMPVFHISRDPNQLTLGSKLLEIVLVVLALVLAALALFFITCDATAITFLVYIATWSIEAGNLNLILTEERITELQTISQMQPVYDLPTWIFPWILRQLHIGLSCS